jgi:hypothetical protein
VDVIEVPGSRFQVVLAIVLEHVSYQVLVRTLYLVLCHMRHQDESTCAMYTVHRSKTKVQVLGTGTRIWCTGSRYRSNMNCDPTVTGPSTSTGVPRDEGTCSTCLVTSTVESFRPIITLRAGKTSGLP